MEQALTSVDQSKTLSN